MPWMPRRRMRAGSGDGSFVPDATGIGPIDAVLLVIALVFLLIMLVPLLVIAGELALLLVALPLWLLAAFLGLRAWTVEVQYEGELAGDGSHELTAGDLVLVQRHRGVRRADRALEELAAGIRIGDIEPIG